jgi:choline dehydrogenase-like flavoprotein
MTKRIDHDDENEAWDAVIIGTGMGGSTLGYALAQAGWRVLFLEKGRSHLAGGNAFLGNYAENFFDKKEAPQNKRREILARAGRYAEEISDHSKASEKRFVPFIGCGTGGSSALYGMALERFRPADLSTWPVNYRSLRDYYETAERLFRVNAPTDLHPANQALSAFLSSRGLHPYRLPLACDFSRGSDRSQGFLDATGAKHDAASVCLSPALREHQAKLIDECEVQRIEARGRRATRVYFLKGGKLRSVSGRIVVLAAGALASPCLLLNSVSAENPNGLANRSGMVGRNLMRHLVDLYLVPTQEDLSHGNLKQIAFNDWYQCDGVTYGTVQSFGSLPAARHLAAELVHELSGSRWWWLAPFARMGFSVLTGAIERKLAGKLIIASILADAPNPDNRVLPGADGAQISLQYRMCADDVKRVGEFRTRMLQMLAPLRPSLLKQAENNQRIAHACGTCRMGDDPERSVLDRFCRAHDLDNLYVVDASFFPTSGGTNPALTIAANALRVANHLISSLSDEWGGRAFQLDASESFQPAH